MLKRELIELLSNIEDEQNVDEILKESEVVKGFIESSQTLESFKGKLTEEEFAKFLNSEKDTHFNKALDTWKANNLEKELQPFIEKNYPELIKDPAKQEVLELKNKLAAIEKEAEREKLLNKAKEYALDKKLPTTFVDLLLAEDEEGTYKNIDSFESNWSKTLESKIAETVKGAGYTPPGVGSSIETSIGAKLAKEKNSVKGTLPSDPWQK